MIEAVNIALQASSLTRQVVEQASTADSFAANPSRVQKAAEPSFLSGPVVYLDLNYDTAVLQVRDSRTGDIVTQIPSEPRLEARARDVARRADVDLAVAETAPAPRQTDNSTQIAAQETSGAEGTADAAQGAQQAAAATAQQLAAFSAASRAGNPNAGAGTATVEIFA